MKVLVMSDTHGYIFNAREALDRHPEVEMVLHLGDYCKDASQLSQLYPGIIFEYVYGNSDIGVGTVSADKTIEIEGVTVFMTHGHKYSVKWDYNRILAKAQAEKASVVLFGHTHVAVIDNIDNKLVINPGSLSESRSSKSESYIIMDVIDDKVNAEIIYI